jgi:hypothetical protein
MSLTSHDLNIGEALKLRSAKTDLINELLAERSRSSWKYGDGSKALRDMDDITSDLTTANADSIALKTAINGANVSNTIVFGTKTITLHEANLMIDYWNKELKSLKKLLKDPSAPDAGDRYSFSRITVDDVLAEPRFDLEDTRAEITVMEVNVRGLDSLRNAKNWSTKLIVDLFQA